MRNAGIAASSGDLVANFDDDDYSAPGRLDDQVQRLLAIGARVTGYHTIRFHDGHDWWLYTGDRNYAVGTSLCFYRDFWQANKFQPIIVGEDNAFVARAAAQRVLVSEHARDLMWASTHSGNTSPRQMSTKQWRKINPDGSGW